MFDSFFHNNQEIFRSNRSNRSNALEMKLRHTLITLSLLLLLLLLCSTRSVLPDSSSQRYTNYVVTDREKPSAEDSRSANHVTTHFVSAIGYVHVPSSCASVCTCSFLCHLYPASSRNSLSFHSFSVVSISSNFSGDVFYFAPPPDKLALHLPTC